MSQTEELPPPTSEKEQQQPQQQRQRRPNNIMSGNPFNSFYSSKKLGKASGTTTTPDEREDGDDDNESNTSRCRSCLKTLAKIYWEQEFLILVVVSILLAMAYPPLGAKYLQPEITASWVAVIFIFFLAGLSLKTSEFSSALSQVYFNGYVQIFSFGVVSAVVFGLATLLSLGNIIRKDLADGIIIAASLPMTISMVQIMTKAAGGDEAAAIFNSAFGNLVGVFLSPALILGYLGVSSNVDAVDVFYKLAARVLLPVIVGQILQYTWKALMEFVAKHKRCIKQAQQYALVFIVYTVFCKTFSKGQQSDIGSIFIMIAFIFFLLVCLMIVAWYSVRFLFPNDLKLCVMGVYGCTHKTVAMGIPLINAMYESSPELGSYTLPIIIWHSLQLVLGSFLAPKLAAFVAREEERLAIATNNEELPQEEQELEFHESKPASKLSTTREQEQHALEEGRVHTHVIMKGTMTPEEETTEFST